MTEELRFNTAISQMMIFVNEMNQKATRPREVMERFILLLAPYAPHIAEEIWERLGHERTLAYDAWPQADERYLARDTVTVVVQVNGKLRDSHELPADMDEARVKEIALASERLQPWIAGKTIVKAFYVPGKLLNLVVK
jgi:leucyl-tRNA synthetase